MPDRQLENYSRWLNEREREKSVTAFRDWLKDEVRFRVEVAEMANGIEPKTFENVRLPRAPRYADLGKMRNFHTVIRNGTRNAVLSVKVLTMVCGSARSSTTKEWMTAGSSPKKGSFVFGAWQLTIEGPLYFLREA